jgi:hypothetical protein
VRDLAGNSVATATVTGTGTTTDPYKYSATGLDPTTDYVVKVVSGTQVLKGLVDKSLLSTTATTTRDIDTVATTAVLLAEKKLSVPLGTIGESASSAVSTSTLAAIQPVALESSVKSAVNAILYAPATATQANIDLVNLANVVAATVNTGVSTSAFLAGTVSTPVTTTQYTLTSGSATANTTASVTTTTAQSTLTTTASSYIAPAANSVSYIEDVYDYTTATGVPLSGVTVSTVGLTQTITTTTDANGVFVLAGIPQGIQFSIKMSKSGFAAAFSNTFSMTANLVYTGRPYALYPPSKLTGWGNTTGNGVIRSRVVASTDLISGYIGGAVVTATDKSGGTTYPVKYIDNATGSISTTLTGTDPLNGQYLIVNVPAGHTVDVTASKSGYTFNTRTFTVQADSVSESRIVGTATATTPPPTPVTGSVQSLFQTGMYDLNKDSYVPTGTTSTAYVYSYVILSTDSNSLMTAVPTYFIKTTGQWSSTAPANGYNPASSGGYDLASTGWVVSQNGPNGSSVVFNADGTATISNPTTGKQSKISVTSVDISNQSIAAGYPKYSSWPITTSGNLFPSGSMRYDIVDTVVNDSYSIWWNSGVTTTITGVPTSSVSIFIDSRSSTNYYCTLAATGNSASIYAQTGTATSLIGTTTWAIATVSGQQILEVAIPSAIRTQYLLGGNPIVAIVNGTAWVGSHPLPNVTDYSGGGTLLNKTALDFLKANFNSALAKPLAKTTFSTVFLGR